MSIQLYTFDHDQVDAVNEWINDNGNKPQASAYYTGSTAATMWESICEVWLGDKMPYDGDNDPVYVPAFDMTVYCSY